MLTPLKSRHQNFVPTAPCDVQWRGPPIRVVRALYPVVKLAVSGPTSRGYPGGGGWLLLYKGYKP